MRSRSFSKRISYDQPLRLLWLLGILCGGSMVLYLWYINGTILMASREERATSARVTLESQVTTLEEQYLNLQESLTRNRATSLGLSDAAPRTFFAARASAGRQTARANTTAN